MDKTDRDILNILQEGSDITNVELARRVTLSPAATLDRVKKLENNGVIRRYVALVDNEKVDKEIMAFVSIALEKHGASEVQKFRNAIKKLPQVLECYHIAGEIDYLLKVVAADIRSFEDFLLSQIAVTPNIGKVHTSFVLSTIKHNTKIPI